MDLAKIKFLLDENIPIQLKRIFTELGLDCTTIQDYNCCGIKDKELSKRLKEKNLVLITRDKDFTFIWKNRSLKIIYFAIEPAILQNIQPRIKELFENLNYPIKDPFLLIVQKDLIRFWKN